MTPPESATRDNNQVLSLFSGAGGLSRGFALAGCKPIAGVEIDRDARATYESNLQVACHPLDLAEVGPSAIRQRIGISNALFAIIGGPPCQGFSSAGARDVNDPRNRLIFNYLHIVGELRPRWFLFENVEGLLTSNGGDSIYQLAREFIRLGYVIRVEKINFAGYGVPQSRKRVLILGNSVGIEFKLPEYTHSYNAGKHWWRGGLQSSPSLGEALAGLGQAAKSIEQDTPYASPSPLNPYDARMRSGNGVGTVMLHYAPRLPQEDQERLAQMRPGQTMKDLPQHMWHESYRRRAFRRVMDGTPTEKRGGAPSGLKRLRSELNSLTITGAATVEFVHPSEDRTLTLRECARLQSFEDSYSFVGSTRSVAQQIGNAVPTIAAEVLCKHIANVDGTFGGGRVSPIRTRKPSLLGFHLTTASGMSPALVKTHSLLASLVDELGLEETREETLESTVGAGQAT